MTAPLSFWNLYPLIAALLALIFGQVLKMITATFQSEPFSLKRFFSSGGMPSSHSAMVASLTTAIGFKEGWLSSPFYIGVIFSLVVLYDAAGIRSAAGKQAILLNQLIENLFDKKELKYEKLREMLGHSPFEVGWGVILGCSVAVLLYYSFIPST